MAGKLEGQELINGLSDIETLALTLYGEARGEPIEGIVAVGNVIKNRVAANKKSFHDICLEPEQFSCWDVNDPNRAILEEVAQKLVYGSPVGELAFDQCLWVAHGIVNSNLGDNTHGARNYVTKQLYDSGHCPQWVIKMRNQIQIGHQIFGTAV